jgi:hypothetical protein
MKTVRNWSLSVMFVFSFSSYMTKFLKTVCYFSCLPVTVPVTGNSCYEGYPKSIQPFWISREPVTWPWCNLAGSQRRPYCASVKNHSLVGLVSRQWDAVDWACVLCDSPINKISLISKAILALGKARSRREPNLGCRGADRPGRWAVLPKQKNKPAREL